MSGKDRALPAAQDRAVVNGVASVSALRASVPSAGEVYHSEPYSMFIEYAPDARGDPTVELWRFRLCEDDGEDGNGYLEIRVHEIVETERSGTLAVYYRQWFAPDGLPAWGNRPKRVIGSLASLRALLRRRKMMLAQGIEAAAADETRSGSAEGESPVAEGHAPNSSRTQAISHD